MKYITQKQLNVLNAMNTNVENSVIQITMMIKEGLKKEFPEENSYLTTSLILSRLKSLEKKRLVERRIICNRAYLFKITEEGKQILNKNINLNCNDCKNFTGYCFYNKKINSKHIIKKADVVCKNFILNKGC